MLRRVAGWLGDRVGFAVLKKPLTDHHIPPQHARRWGWMYIFGSATLTAFIVQVVTGIALASKYVPSPESAHQSLVHITEAAFLGSFLRAMHYFGASAMILLVMVHMARVYLTGSYKFPRELNWISGVVLLGLVFVMGFTGQLLRFDENGVWTVVVVSKFVSRVPWVGSWLAEFVLAGDTIDGTTLTRFYALHVLLVPLLIGAVVGLHLFLVLHHGISEPPKAGEPVDPATYREKYEALEKAGPPYFPFGIWREAVFSTVVVLSIIGLALYFGPRGPHAPPDPTFLQADPRPDWFLIWYYALLFVKPRGWEAFTMIYLPLLVGAGLFLLPILFNKGERAPSKRPWAVAIVAFVALVFGLLLVHGLRAPWVPAFDTRPLGAAQLGDVPPAVLEGAEVFHRRGCQYCHRVLGEGGRYGPDLTDVTRRMSDGEITVRTIDGIRDMPAYRDTIDAEEMRLILAFLHGVPR
jgi:ubiquinol-cytochrome c reductase cytochrome b subunit